MRDAEIRESRSEREQSNGAGTVVAVVAIVCLVLLPFVPLLLSGLESSTLGTNCVESSCEKAGIHGVLTALYDSTVFRWFK